MRKSKITDSQVMDALKRVDAGLAVPELCREHPAQEDVCRGAAQSRDPAGVHHKKMVRPSRRHEMAKRVVEQHGISIGLACDLFQVSQTCYRYEAQLNAENEQIANWLLRLTDNNRF